MNRSPKQIIEALRFAAVNGNSLMIGDNELARLVLYIGSLEEANAAKAADEARTAYLRDVDCNDQMGALNAALKAAFERAAAGGEQGGEEIEGYALVPIRPTPDMKAEGERTLALGGAAHTIYWRMVVAALAAGERGGEQASPSTETANTSNT